MGDISRDKSTGNGFKKIWRPRKSQKVESEKVEI